LFSSIDFGDAHTVKNNSLQAKLLSSELSSIFNKTSFVSSICFAIENPFQYQKVNIIKCGSNSHVTKKYISDTKTVTTPHQSNIKGSQLLTNPGDFFGYSS
jgi:hypothetical protein